MEPIVVIILAVIVVAILAAAFVAMMRRRRRAELQERFGPEYERTVTATGNRREAEQHLASVADRRDRLPIRELEPARRAEYTTRWTAIQAHFVEAPADAVDEADGLLTEVLVERGYPVERFEDRADLVAADHPDVVEHYRSAHAAHERHRSTGAADTEDLRQSFVHYRALFDVLVGEPDSDVNDAATQDGGRAARLDDMPPQRSDTAHEGVGR